MKSIFILMFLSFGAYAEQISYNYKITKNVARKQLSILQQLRIEYEDALQLVEDAITTRNDYIKAWNEYNMARYESIEQLPELQQFKKHDFLTATEKYHKTWDELEKQTPKINRLGDDFLKAREEYIRLLSKLKELEEGDPSSEITEARNH